jgi:hypothetical protein
MKSMIKSLGNDPIFILLLFATFIFASMLIFVEYRFQNDGQMFQVMSNLTSSFAGAVLLRAKPVTVPTKEDYSTTTGSISSTGLTGTGKLPTVNNNSTTILDPNSSAEIK